MRIHARIIFSRLFHVGAIESKKLTVKDIYLTHVYFLSKFLRQTDLTYIFTNEILYDQQLLTQKYKVKFVVKSFRTTLIFLFSAQAFLCYLLLKYTAQVLLPKKYRNSNVSKPCNLFITGVCNCCNFATGNRPVSLQIYLTLKQEHLTCDKDLYRVVYLSSNCGQKVRFAFSSRSR